jgi:hypothetical protein
MGGGELLTGSAATVGRQLAEVRMSASRSQRARSDAYVPPDR